MIRYQRPIMRDRRQDYAGPGTWFITINAWGGLCIFGQIRDGAMHRNRLGALAHEQLQILPARFPLAALDEFVVMPNHVHLILCLLERDSRLRTSDDTQRRFGRPVPGTVGTIINLFKGAVTCAARRFAGQRIMVWQDQFVDMRIRSRDMLLRKRAYIRDNPTRWHDQHPRQGPVLGLPRDLPEQYW